MGDEVLDTKVNSEKLNHSSKPTEQKSNQLKCHDKPQYNEVLSKTSCVSSAVSPTAYYNMRSPGAYSVDENTTPSPQARNAMSPRQNGPDSNKVASRPFNNTTFFNGKHMSKTSPILDQQLAQLAQQLDQSSIDQSGAVFMENGYGSSSPLSLSNSASSAAMSDSELSSGEDDPLSMDQSIFSQNKLGKSIGDNKVRGQEDFCSYFQCPTLTVPLEYINEETQDTVF